MNRNYQRPLPEELEGLEGLAIDLRWTSRQLSDRIWRLLDEDAWERTKNPIMILENVSQTRLEEAAKDESLTKELKYWLSRRRMFLGQPGWFKRKYSGMGLIACFSMEFGLSEALPIYSGGLGILSGDLLKSSSDLDVPLIGVGLLYQQGYFRQILAEDGSQIEAFPYNDPTSLPIVPVEDREGGWLRTEINLPGRSVLLRVWQAKIGRVKLYLLDSNDPLNGPWDRGITASLYPAGQERRLIQEIALGIGGWQALEELGFDVDVCHINEGHAAFVILARAYSFMKKMGTNFPVSLWATRAGNVFTTHTPVAASFDSFDASLISKYLKEYAARLGVSINELMALGRANPTDQNSELVMPNLAIRGSFFVNGVSQLHGQVSRAIFQDLYPRWPQNEVPVKHITNGVHIPTWDSPESHELWSHACGDNFFWLASKGKPCPMVAQLSDSKIWKFRNGERKSLVEYTRQRLVRQLHEHSAPTDLIERAQKVLDPDILTIGFARRFTSYKRPTIVLHDAERFARILLDPKRPVQMIVAGKAHPSDDEGKEMVKAMARFASRLALFDRVVFIEDYDIALAQKLVSGIDLWINVPRRPMEACGTSGMKVLVNGGLNLSELDGWWAEAYSSEVGWALGDGREHNEPGWDDYEAEQLYRCLEQHIVPEFYERNSEGIPEAWVERIRASMSRLAPQFSASRMLREYVEKAYVPAAEAYHRREADKAKLAYELDEWHRKLSDGWESLRFGDLRVDKVDDQWNFEVQVYLGDLNYNTIKVELYADPLENENPTEIIMKMKEPIAGATNGYIYAIRIPASRPSEHYTPRIVPYHPEALIPQENANILWMH
jgi:starch phosphorylase